MKRKRSCAWLATVIGCLAVSSALAGPKWVSIGEFQVTGGDKGKIAPYNGPVTACRIVCTEGSIIVNTFIILEGNKKTPIPVAVRIPAGQMHEITLPDGPRTVTGFRISDNARGKYRLEVINGGGGGKGGVTSSEPAPAKKKKKNNELVDALLSTVTTPSEGDASAPQPSPSAPVMLPAPAGLPQPVAVEPVPEPRMEAPVQIEEPSPVPPAAPAEKSAETPGGGAAPLPWE